MREFRFVTEYEGLKKAIRTRLKSIGDICFDDASMKAFVSEDHEEELAGLIAETVLMDLKSIELDRLSRVFSLCKKDRELLIPLAERYTDDASLYEYAVKAVHECMEEYDTICPEGLLRFRMPLVIEKWAYALERAAEELVFSEERTELFRLMSALFCVYGDAECGGEVRLVLYPDGSGVFSSAEGIRIECSPALEAPVCGILCALSPMRLVVYDMAGIGREGIKRSIRSLMGDRAVFFETGK